MRLVVLAAILVTGCTANLPLDASTLVTCATDADCPNGLVCVNAERCADPDALNTGELTLATPGIDALLAADKPVVFTWSTVTGAIRYHLVVTDTSGAKVIDETVEITSYSTSMSAGTYTWTVVSDITDRSSAAPPQRFGVIDDAVFVYCGEGDCGATTGELGTAALPFRAISRGVTGALKAGVRIVRIAKRPGDAPYGEVISVQSGITLSGGYTSNFASRDGRTTIALADTPLYAAFISETTGLEHLAFTNTRVDTSSTVASFFRCSSALTLTDTLLTTNYWSTNVLRVEEQADDIGPQLVDSVVTGTLPLQGAVPAELHVIEVNNAALTLRNTKVQGTTTRALKPKTNSMSIVEVMDGTLSVADSQLNLDVQRDALTNTELATVVGVRLTEASYLSHGSKVTVHASNVSSAMGIETLGSNTKAELTDSSVDVSAPVAYGVYLADSYNGLTAVRSRLAATSADGFGTARTVHGGDNAIIDIEASFISASARAVSDGLYFSNVAFGLIASSTIVATADIPRPLYANATSLRVVNNLIVGPGGCPRFCAGVVLDGGDAYKALGAFANNVIAGFPTVNNLSCPFVAGGSTYAKCTSPNAAGTTNPRPYLAGNLTLDAIEGADLDVASYRPRATSLLARSGVSPASDVCRQIGTATDFTFDAPACGGTTLDFDGELLETPAPTIGYLRAAP